MAIGISLCESEHKNHKCQKTGVISDTKQIVAWRLERTISLKRMCNIQKNKTAMQVHIFILFDCRPDKKATKQVNTEDNLPDE